MLQKDKVIESLRLELAEAQIKLVEIENMGGGQLQQLEKTLMEARMANARLMEDNESFQLLLSEKTLNGDLTQSDLLRPHSITSDRPSSRRETSSSLADELGNATDEEEDNSHKANAEIASLKDQNKALTLYINNIISRLLEHSEFEAILDKNPNLINGNEAPTTKPATVNKEKALPPPPESDGLAVPSLLDRTRSIIGGRPKARPLSQVGPTEVVPPLPTANENPDTAPRIPIRGGQAQRSSSGSHRRSNSDWAAAAVINTMYRGPSPGASGQLSPGIVSQSGSSFFSVASTGRPTGSRIPSGTTIPTISENDKLSTNRDSRLSSGRNSVTSDPDGRASPPHSTTSSGDRPSGAIMGGNKIRPLRLVQEAAEQDEAAKKANRSSWMGWFNKSTGAVKGPGEEKPQQGSGSVWPPSQ